MTTTAAVLEVETRAAPRTRLRWAFLAIVAALPAIWIVALSVQLWVASVIPMDAVDALRMGSLASTGESKSGDVAFPLVFFGLLIGLGVWLRSRVRAFGFRAKRYVAVQAIIAAPVLASMLLGTSRPLLEAVDSPLLLAVFLQLAPTVFWIAVALNERKRAKPDDADLNFSAFLYLSPAAGMSALGLTAALRQLITPGALPEAVSIGIALAVTLALSIALALISASRRSVLRIRTAIALMVLSLLALPLLFPAVANIDSVTALVPGPDLRVWKLVVAAAGAVIVIETLLRTRFRRSDKWTAGLASTGVAALIVPLRAYYGVPQIWGDDYHFGESLAPLGLWRDFGQTPYVDQFLPRGIFLNIFPQAVNTAVNDGSAAASAFVYVLIAFAVVSIAHLLLRRSMGFGMATAMVALIATANMFVEGDLLLGAMLISTLAFILRRPNPYLLGAVVVLVSAAGILLYPMMGIVATGIFVGVLGLATAGSALSRNKSELIYVAKAVLAVILSVVLLALTPFASLLAAAVKYVVLNGMSNSEAFGVALNSTWLSPYAIGPTISMSFMIGLLVALWLLWRRRTLFAAPSWRNYMELGVASVPAVFVAVLLGRFLGRIDVGEWSSRPAWGSLLVLGIILPGVLVLLTGDRLRKLAWWSIGAAALISAVTLPIGQSGLLRSSLGMLTVSTAGWTSASEAKAVPGLGVGAGNAAHRAEVELIAKMSRGIDREEAVLNLSNRGALFGYLGWRNPIPYLAPYNIESAAAEQQVLDTLAEDPPTYIYVGPGPQHDGMSLSLRNPELARWVTERYTPIRCGDHTWATLGVGASSIGDGALNCLDRDRTMTPSEIWAEGFATPSDLILAPATWGERSEFAVDDADRVAVKPVRSEPGQVFEIPVEQSTLASSDLLVIDAQCPANRSATEPSTRVNGGSRAVLTWGEETSLEEASFEWGAGTFVVPLDAYPMWRGTAEDRLDVGKLRLSVPDIDCSTGWSVNAQFAPR